MDRLWFQNMKYFRIGEFKNATEHVKKCWICFVGILMPCLSKKWTDEAVRFSSLLSKHTSPSDEAFAILALEKKSNQWIKDYTECDEETSQEQGKKKSRELWNDSEIQKFYELKVKITKLRKDLVTGEGWDCGYRKHLESTCSPSKQVTKRNNELLKQAFMEELDTNTLCSTRNNVNTSINQRSTESMTTITACSNIPRYLDDDVDDDDHGGGDD